MRVLRNLPFVEEASTVLLAKLGAQVLHCAMQMETPRPEPQPFLDVLNTFDTEKRLKMKATASNPSVLPWKSNHPWPLKMLSEAHVSCGAPAGRPWQPLRQRRTRT